MRKSAMPHSNTSEGRRVGPAMTIDNMWKMFLLFVVLGILNNVYVTQHVLLPQFESYRYDLQLYYSFTGEDYANSTAIEVANKFPKEFRNSRVAAIRNNQKMAAARDHFAEIRRKGFNSTAPKTRQFHNISFLKPNRNSPNLVPGKALEPNFVHTNVPKRDNAPKEIDATIKVPKRDNAPKEVDAIDSTKESENIEYTPRAKAKKKKKKHHKDHKKDENRTYSPEQLAKWAVNETVTMPNISNSIFYRDIPEEFLAEDPSTFLWDQPELRVPQWMKDYFRWHRWKRSTWKDPTDDSNEDWRESERWMISQCLMSQDRRKCGGTADRLKPIPTLLRAAYENKRVFLIRWTRPAPLEQFLSPPAGGFDWRIPPALDEYIEDEKKGKRYSTRGLILKFAPSGLSLLRVRYQTGSPDESYNNLVFDENSTEIGSRDNQDEFGYDPIFSRLWRVMFTPSPPIQKLLHSKLSSLGLVPNEYVGSHLRALYRVEDRPVNIINMFTENALACATQIYPGVPIFFASDAAQALEYAQSFNEKEVLDYYNDQTIKLKVLTAADGKKTNDDGKGNSTLNHPWHLDSYIGPVENFYDTFVDIYMLAMAGCVTYGTGGYGHWGMLIGGHTQCHLLQFKNLNRLTNPDKELCKFRATTETFESITKNFHSSHPSVFGNGDPKSGPLVLPPME